MNGFDRDDELISQKLEALGQEISVPDMLPGIRAKLERPPRRQRKPLRFAVALAAVIAVLGVSALAAASLGGFDWLKEKIDPPFASVVAETEQSAEDQGIKLTVVAAGSYDDMAMLYVTLEDTAGLGRIQEDTQPLFEPNSGVSSIRPDPIYFDAETGVAAYQVRLGTNDTFDGQSALSLSMDGLRYGHTDIGEARVDLDLAKAVADGEHVGEPYSDPTHCPSENLTPGHLAGIPGTNSAWVSAIGVLHGYLTVQFGQPVGKNYMSLGANDISPYLLDADGNRVDPMPWGTSGPVDAQLQGIETWPPNAAYILTQSYFNVDTENLAGYTLCFEGNAWNMLAGDWDLNVNLNSIQTAKETAADFTIDNGDTLEVTVTVTPLGITLTGYYPGALMLKALFADAILETATGDITIHPSYGGQSDPSSDSPFENVWLAPSAIDVNSVTAVRIGDNRIEFAP